MAYDVIGNVVDSKNNPIAGLVVDDGVQGISTNNDGYYEIKPTNKILNFRMVGYKPQTFDLSKYKDGSSVNVDITMEEVDSSVSKPLEITDKRPLPKTIKPPVETPTSPFKVGLGVGLLVGLVTFGIAKWKLKNMQMILGISAGAFALSGTTAFMIQSKKNEKNR